MITIPCPFAQSIAAYMTITPPAFKPFRRMDLEDMRKSKLIDPQERPVERKGLGEIVDTYA